MIDRDLRNGSLCHHLHYSGPRGISLLGGSPTGTVHLSINSTTHLRVEEHDLRSLFYALESILWIEVRCYV